MSKVKICGITSLVDATVAAEAGADAIGFNFFAKSPRYISPDAARQIAVRISSNVYKVGVFVNEPVESVVRAAADVGLDAVQLHGDETPRFVDDLKQQIGCDVIKAFRVSTSFRPEDALEYAADGILLDAFSKTEFGGTGETFDWTRAKAVGALVERLWLAGGLTPENVAAAIAEVDPYAVDACSSLESAPGIKDAAKVRQFIVGARKQ